MYTSVRRYVLFPSPCGDYGSYLLCYILFIVAKKLLGFRPLAGIMVLIKLKEMLINQMYEMGFRPLAGIMVLICFDNLSYAPLHVSFRPLAGIMVLIYTVKKVVDIADGVVSVPLRGLWFLSWYEALALAIFAVVVSVPLRGLWFLSKTIFNYQRTNRKAVSVPLRGLWFLSGCGKRGQHERHNKFPSPCGDYGSYHDKQQACCQSL